VILIDTQAVLWLATRPQRLSRRARLAVQRIEAGGGLAIASVTLMELAQRVANGEIRPTGTPLEWLQDFVEEKALAIIAVSVDIAVVAAHLPASFPSDPFERLIAATAIVERMPLVTADARIRNSGVVKTIW
jgi:PIN domain nuclease of toxin-antitoxin system